MSSPPIDIRKRPPYTLDQLPVKSEYKSEFKSILIPEGEIESRISQLATEISDEYRTRDGTEVYAACVLKGAMRYFGALTPQLDLEGAFCEGAIRASRYAGGDGQDQTEVRFLDPEMIAGKDILIVEDIIDEGFTLKAILEQIWEYNPNSVSTTVLFDKADRRKVDIDIEFTGFTIPDKFVVGYGLDYDEQYRNVRHLAVVDH